ncbi:MAG TPA: methionyl-tRNA formyltransferase [Gemmatimonadaceae bacterium]|nr:methionyl-tRNA formyltransferase [Gemmatimonadaceae bacterium]
MRMVLIGAVDSTRVALEALARHGAPPAALFTLAPGRGARRHSDYVELRPLAERLGVPVVEAPDVNAPEALARLRLLAPDYALVIGWSQLCRAEFLRTPRLGAVGFHPAPLPENRGRAVIPWTILQGRADTGATLFWMDEGADSGDVLLQERFAVAPDETAATLYAKHLAALGRMLDRAIPQLLLGTAPRVPQDHARATYCAKRVRADGLIDWRAPAREVWRLVRAVGDPYPGAFTHLRGRALTVWAADYVGPAPYHGLPGQVQALGDGGALVQCGDGEHVLLRTVQPEGDDERADAQTLLRIHERLGVDLGELMVLYERLRERQAEGEREGKGDARRDAPSVVGAS